MDKNPNLLVKSEYLQEIRRPNSSVFFHSLYGNAIELESSKARLIDLFNLPFKIPEEENKETIEQLISSKLIVPESCNEREELETILEHRKQNLDSGYLIRSLQLNIAEICNFHCRYCIQNRTERGIFDRVEELKFNHKKMDWETAKKSIDGFMNILERNGNKNAHVMFFGGEPLMNWDVLERSLEYIKTNFPEMNTSYVITTNGSLITPGRARKLKEHNVAVQISLDGLKETNDKNRIYKIGKGTFDIVDKGIKALARENVNLSLGVVISEESFDSVTTKFIDYAIMNGVSNIEVNPEERLYQTDRKLEISDKLLELISYGVSNNINVFSLLEIPLLKTVYRRQGFCSAVGSALSVEPSGDIYFCRCLSGKAGTADEMDSILKSEEYKNTALRLENNIEGCYGCTIEGLCGGGCAANAEKLVGDVLEKDSTRCEMIRKLTFEELRKYGLRRLSDKGEELVKNYLNGRETIKQTLNESGLTFWDRELIRNRLSQKKEKEYVPVRLILL